MTKQEFIKKRVDNLYINSLCSELASLKTIHKYILLCLKQAKQTNDTELLEFINPYEREIYSRRIASELRCV